MGETREKELERVAAGAGISRDFFGVLTAVPITSLCVLQYDFITVFVTAGTEPVKDTGRVNIIVYSSEGMADSALLEMIMVATEAKTLGAACIGTRYTRPDCKCHHHRMRRGSPAPLTGTDCCDARAGVYRGIQGSS